MKRLVPFSVFLLLAGCSGKTDEAEGTEATPTAVASVRTAPAVLASSREAITVYGTAEAAPGAEHALTVPSEAIVAAIDAPTGTPVHAGQAIVTLRPSPAARADVAKAASDLAAADAAYQRALRLRKDGLVSDADVETARAAARSAAATRAGLRVGTGGLVLRAPVAGMVQGLTAKAGDQLGAGTTIATVAVPGALRARFGVDPALTRRIRPGQPITLSTIAGGPPIATNIVGIDAAVDAATRLAAIFARIPAGATIGAGEPLRASIATGAISAGIVIPYAALLDEGGRSYVFIVKDGVAHSRDVSPGNSADDTIRILKGLQPGERVVTEGGTALADGMKVREDAAGPSGQAAK